MPLNLGDGPTRTVEQRREIELRSFETPDFRGADANFPTVGAFTFLVNEAAKLIFQSQLEKCVAPDRTLNGMPKQRVIWLLSAGIDGVGSKTEPTSNLFGN